MNTAMIGNGMIASSAFIGPDVQLGHEVSVGEGAVISGHCSIGDGCIIEAGAVLNGAGEGLVIEPGVTIMTGVVIGGSLTIGQHARIQPGAVVLRSVPPYAIVSGNPAQITGYTLTNEPLFSSGGTLLHPSNSSEITTTRVKGVTLHRFAKILDLRGNLTVGEFGRSVPFEPKRYFMVFDVPNAEIRGEHAHRICKQFLICTHGSCRVVADDGKNREEFLLEDPSVGLYLPPLTWGIQYKYSPDAILLVFASHFYDSAEYIRNYDEFIRLAALPS